MRFGLLPAVLLLGMSAAFAQTGSRHRAPDVTEVERRNAAAAEDTRLRDTRFDAEVKRATSSICDGCSGPTFRDQRAWKLPRPPEDRPYDADEVEPLAPDQR